MPRHPGLWWQAFSALFSPPQPCPLEPQNPPPGGQRHPPASSLPHTSPHWPLELHLSRWWELSWRPQPKPLRQHPSWLPALPYQPVHQLWPLPLAGLRPLRSQGWPLKRLGHAFTVWPLLRAFSHLPFCPVLNQRLAHAALISYSAPQPCRLAPNRPGLGGLQQAPGWHQRESSPPQDTGAQTIQVPNATQRRQVLNPASTPIAQGQLSLMDAKNFGSQEQSVGPFPLL